MKISDSQYTNIIVTIFTIIFFMFTVTYILSDAVDKLSNSGMLMAKIISVVVCMLIVTMAYFYLFKKNIK